MKKIKSRIAKEFSKIFLVLLFFAPNSFAATSRNLTIFTESNMVFALTKIAHLYSQRANVIVSTNFNSAADLIANIDSGEPADVFISAHSKSIQTLRQKGLIDVYNIGYVARDELALTTSKNNKNLPAQLQQQISLNEALKVLSQNKFALLLDSEGSSSGKFSREFVANNPNFSNLKLSKKSAEDRSQIVSSIKADPSQYALLLASQVKNDSDLKILSASNQDPKIFYQALVIAGDNMEVAREFLKFLKSDEARKIFAEAGFELN